MKPITKTLIQLSNHLSHTTYTDGTKLGETLNLTRAAIWKAIKKLQHYGVTIHSIKGKGYRLEKPLQLLDPEKIRTLANTDIDIQVAETIDSTSTYLEHHTPQQTTLCLAETQTQGKGRLERHWHSPFGQNIYYSLSYRFNQDISELSGLSLVMGLAVCKAIESFCHIPTPLQVKWPNDIIVDNQKLAGILIVLQAEAHNTCRAIISTGINVNTEKQHKQNISQPWVSLQQLTQTYHDRNALAAKLIQTMLAHLEQFSQQGLSSFTSEWQKRDSLANQNVQLNFHKKTFQGHYAGINDQGHLLLNLKDGQQRAFASGEASRIRKR